MIVSVIWLVLMQLMAMMASIASSSNWRPLEMDVSWLIFVDFQDLQDMRANEIAPILQPLYKNRRMETDGLLGKHRNGSLYTWNGIQEEVIALWSICWKITIATFCQLSVLTVSTAFLGHLGTHELASSALVMSLVGGFRVISWSFSVSISTVSRNSIAHFEILL